MHRLQLLIGSAAFLCIMPAAAQPAAENPKSAAAAARMIDFVDPTYGGRVRQIYNPAGDEHDLYHYRTPFNADNTYLLGIETPRGSKDYQVTLYDGDGVLLRRLFTVPEYSWKLVWDRKNPHVFYTERQKAIYRYDVETNEATLLRDFAPLSFSPAGPSLNQAGDRILVTTAPDRMVRSFRLPAMDDERAFRLEVPKGRYAAWDKLRFIGYRDFVAVTLVENEPSPRAAPNPLTQIYDASTGELAHSLEGINIGHHDFSPDGRLAYFRGYPRQTSFQVRLMNIDGTDDRLLYEVPQASLRFIRSGHITWPDGVNDWFTVSFFPDINRLPPKYDPPLDDLMRIHTDGKVEFLARTGTACGENFWAQPQQSPSADGTRVLFHTNAECEVGETGFESSGTIDQCILYLD